MREGLTGGRWKEVLMADLLGETLVEDHLEGMLMEDLLTEVRMIEKLKGDLFLQDPRGPLIQREVVNAETDLMHHLTTDFHHMKNTTPCKWIMTQLTEDKMKEDFPAFWILTLKTRDSETEEAGGEWKEREAGEDLREVEVVDLAESSHPMAILIIPWKKDTMTNNLKRRCLALVKNLETSSLAVTLIQG